MSKEEVEKIIGSWPKAHGLKKSDDFNWDTYTGIYESVMNSDLVGKHDMIVSDYELVDGKVVFEGTLHANWREIYSRVHTLGVNSVFEVGCGCTHHLINIKNMNPEMTINGCDYSKSQINLGYKYFNLGDYDFHDRLTVKDMTVDDGITEMGQHELVYSQAVSMHLSHDKVKKFLVNMGKLSSKYLMMVENICCHDYLELFKELLPDFEVVQSFGEGIYIPNSVLLKRKDNE